MSIFAYELGRQYAAVKAASDIDTFMPPPTKPVVEQARHDRRLALGAINPTHPTQVRLQKRRQREFETAVNKPPSLSSYPRLPRSAYIPDPPPQLLNPDQAQLVYRRLDDDPEWQQQQSSSNVVGNTPGL